MKTIAKISLMLVMSMIAGSAIATGLDLNPHLVVPSVMALSFIPTPQGAFFAVAKNQIVVAELLKQFQDMKDDFLAPLKSHDDKVNNDVINFNDIGAAPEVIIDNITYPITSSGRTDDKRPVSLYKLETKNTIITDDEIHALPYDKKSSVIAQHKDSLKLATIKLGAYSLAPASHSSNTPVLRTTGELVDGRRRMTVADIIAYKAVCDILEIPVETRNLVLSSEHASDLLLVDNTFRDRYNVIATGQVIKNMYGFNMFESIHTPKFDGSFVKKAFGAAPSGTDKNASVFYSTLNAFKATGSINMYFADAASDPEMRESRVGFRMYYIVAPVSVKGTGGIVSGSDAGSTSI